MGIYLNPMNELFLKASNSDIYVDHSLMIEYTNHVLSKSNDKLCVSRPRRFGKSTDANMLVAYYSKGCDSSDIFARLKISESPSYKEHLNQHHVIYLNMQDFLSQTHDIKKLIELLSKRVTNELKRNYQIEFFDLSNFTLSLEDIYSQTQDKFIFIIDEWDCIFREKNQNKEAQDIYLDFLRNLLKDKPYVELAYMTGILPIKKYGTHSALNMFDEISMIDSTPLSKYMGFTEKEVKELCDQYQVNYQEMKKWYDGYHLTKDITVLSPRSVVSSIERKNFGNYWTSTETYEALKIYIDMNFDGLKDDVIKMLAGESVAVETTSFQNDMMTFKTKDDVLTLLIHLGYLGYNMADKTCYIPNMEVTDSFVNSIKTSSWSQTTKALLNSRKLLEATWNKNEEEVAKYIEEAHLETSILQYNDENALSYTVSLAYYCTRDEYKIIRECPSGKGYADMIFIPQRDKPAMIVELKRDEDVEKAINQIKERRYETIIKEQKKILYVAIVYNSKTKKHTCKIEEKINKCF